MTHITSLAMLIAVFTLVIQPSNAQQKLPTTAQVFAKLKEKRDTGGIQTYKLEFDHRSLQNAGGTSREVWEFQIDWKTGKFRQAGWDGRPSNRFELIKVYDSEKIKTQYRDVTSEGKPVGDGSWKFGMVTGRLNSGTFQTHYWPMFFHAGAIAGLDDRYYAGHFVFDPDVEKFMPPTEMVRDGRKCILLKTFPENPVGPMQYEYIIDPKKDYAIVGFTYYRKNTPDVSLDIDVGPAKQGSRWDLLGWTHTSFGAKGAAEQITKVKVSTFAEHLETGPNNKFDLVPPEGAKVMRNHLELPAGAQDLKDTRYDYEMRDGKLVQTAGPNPPLWDRVRENWHWYALGAGLAAAAFASLWMRRGWLRRPGVPRVPPTSTGD